MNAHICLIGEVVLDVTLGDFAPTAKMRLGGIIHAARALWAMNIKYDLVFIAPSYMHAQIDQYASRHGASSVICAGTIEGAPNVILIRDVKEAGSQGYELLLRDEYVCTLDDDNLSAGLLAEHITDIAIFPGSYDLNRVLEVCGSSDAAIHIDVANGVSDLGHLNTCGKILDTIIVSTSSPLFLDTYGKSVPRIRDACLATLGNHFMLKENRGGTRLYSKEHPENPLIVGAQVQPIAHSVGVGDCFDVAYAALKHSQNTASSLGYAAWIAGEYAATTYVDDFKRACQRVLSTPADLLLQNPGVILPWEARPAINVYIAAPDFDYMDRRPINQLASSLEYHNFSPRLPVRENGQVQPDASAIRRAEIFGADMTILQQCQILVAVMIDNDPGTLIEVGLAAGLRKPVIVYDPFYRASNIMLTELPQVVTSDLDVVIASVFEHAARLV